MTLLDPPLMGEDVSSGLPILMLAMDIVGSSCVFLTVDSEGLMALQDASKIKSDWRYDMRESRWYDASIGLGENDG